MTVETPTAESGKAQRRARRKDDLVLTARNLTRRYGDLLAVDDVSFGVTAGEVVGLLGPNGAGKTTIMRMLTTMLAPSGGDFRLLDNDSGQATAIRRRIGVFPENSASPGNHSGHDELEYHARLHGHSRDAASELAKILLEEVGLADAGARLSRGYSRGMRQRLGIARALVGDPAVIFLDEPTLGLDPAGRRAVLNVILDAASRRGAAVIVSTHLLDEVERVCDRVLIMNRGRLVAQGTVDELRARAGLPSLAVIHVDGDPEVARAALLDLGAVQNVANRNSASGELRAAVDEGAGDAVPEIVGALAAAGVRVTSFSLNPAGLEDVFLELTEGSR